MSSVCCLCYLLRTYSSSMWCVVVTHVRWYKMFNVTPENYTIAFLKDKLTLIWIPHIRLAIKIEIARRRSFKRGMKVFPINIQNTTDDAVRMDMWIMTLTVQRFVEPWLGNVQFDRLMIHPEYLVKVIKRRFECNSPKLFIFRVIEYKCILRSIIRCIREPV